MRVLQIGGLSGPGPIAGGVWRVAETQTQILRRRGHEVHLVGLWLDDCAIPSDGDTHFWACRRLFPGAGLRGLYVSELKAKLDALGSFDAAHIHFSRDYFTNRCLRILGEVGVPIIVQTHGMLSMPPKMTTRIFDLFFKHSYLKIPASWLSLTELEYASLVRLGVPASMIEPIVNAVEPSGFHWAPLKPGYVLFASRLHPRKGADVFVEAGLAVLRKNPDIRFLIAGPDEGSLERILELIEESQVGSERFDIVGGVEPRRVKELLAGARCLVLPSRGEIAPMVVIEACEIGTPVILTSDCGLSAGLRRAGAARIVDPSVENVTRAIEQILGDQESTAELSRNGRAHYRREWSPDCVGEALEREYVKVATGSQ